MFEYVVWYTVSRIRVCSSSVQMTLPHDPPSSSARRIFGEAVQRRISETQVLLVGAGGIGCELMKSLVLSGFQHISVMDLDTVDVSNLNRQFLFRKNHVGQSKAAVAREAVLDFCPTAQITAYHANVKDSQFDARFYKKFDVVLNALDNQDARRHVNRLCLASARPLIDSGSAGYNGQVMPIIPQDTECYDCSSKPMPKSYAVCTIRSTPDRPEHCIFWAKHLWGLLFGPDKDGNLLEDARQAISTGPALPNDASSSKEQLYNYACHVMKYFFHQDIQKQNDLPHIWEKRPHYMHPRLLTIPEDLGSKIGVSTAHTDHWYHTKVWSVATCMEKFANCIVSVYTTRQDVLGSLEFDKDDDLAMDFVTAAANLRMENYHIQRVSRWECQSIAGSIIPAIASTNAIVAGMQVVQLIHWVTSYGTKVTSDDTPMVVPPDPPAGPEHNAKILAEDTRLRYVWIKAWPSGNFLVLPDALETQNPQCYVCGQKQVAVHVIRCEDWSLAEFVRTVIQRGLGTNEPIVATGLKCIWDPDDSNPTGTNELKSLEHWEVHDGTILTVTDFTQEGFQCDLFVLECASLDQKTHPEGFELTTKLTPPKRMEETEEESGQESGDESVIPIRDVDVASPRFPPPGATLKSETSPVPLDGGQPTTPSRKRKHLNT